MRRNFALGVINGALFTATVRLMDAGGLFGLLILYLTDSAQMIGVVVFVTSVGWYWPAIGVASLVEHQKHKLPWYHYPAIVRLACLWAMVALLFTGLPISHPWPSYWALVGLTFIQMSACGVSYIPFMDIVGKTVPPAKRGLFLALRMAFGEVLGLGAAAVAGYLLSARSGLEAPRSFAYMVLMATVIRTVSLGSFCLVREPERPVQRHRLPFRLFFWRGVRVFRRERSFRNFTFLRIAYTLGSMAFPFIAAFAITELGVSEATIATYMIVNSVAVLLANVLWGRLGDAHGNRMVLRMYSALATLPIALGLLCAHLPATDLRLPLAGPVSLHALLIGVVFFCSGLAGPARHLGETNYILDLAPETRRSTYLAFSQTTMAPLTVVPLLAGWIADSVSYVALFGLTLVFAILANVLSAVGLEEPRSAQTQREAA